MNDLINENGYIKLIGDNKKLICNFGHEDDIRHCFDIYSEKVVNIQNDLNQYRYKSSNKPFKYSDLTKYGEFYEIRYNDDTNKIYSVKQNKFINIKKIISGTTVVYVNNKLTLQIFLDSIDEFIYINLETLGIF